MIRNVHQFVSHVGCRQDRQGRLPCSLGPQLFLSTSRCLLSLALTLLVWGIFEKNAAAGIKFQPTNPDTSSDIFAITDASGGYTNVDVRWSGPVSGNAGCAPGKPCGEKSGGRFTWWHRLGKLPAGTYSVVFQADQCKPCDTTTLIVSPPCQPQAEACDNKDNDCNGQIDEGLERDCYGGPAGTKDIGICKGGKQICIAGVWATCQGEQKPQQETCNDKKDNDCNGQVDENCECQTGQTQPCYTGPPATRDLGICKAGTQTCQNGVWSNCTGEQLPAAQEICDDGKDNNCNGQTDEGCGSCTNGASRPCYSGPQNTANVGACKAGTQTCTNGAWSICQGEALPAPKEICGNGTDDDCDGTIDNGCNNSEAPSSSESSIRLDAGNPGQPDNSNDSISCPNGRIVWNCTPQGQCTQICRAIQKGGCACDTSTPDAVPWVFFCLFALLGLLSTRRKSLHVMRKI